MGEQGVGVPLGGNTGNMRETVAVEQFCVFIFFFGYLNMIK